MYSKLVLIIVTIYDCKAMHLNRTSSTKVIHKDIPMDAIENWLTKPLLTIEHLHLYLRRSNYQEDVANSYTQWFLHQIFVPIIVNIYELESEARAENYNGNHNVIVTSMQNLRSTARQFEKRAATYFFIVNGVIDFEQIRDFFYLYWKRSHIYKNYLLTDNGVFIYDPLALHESGNYGKVIEYSGKDAVDHTLFYNMHGYPMRVQLFKSVYSRPVVDPATNKVKLANGVDGRVANLLQEKINFTMLLQYPDPNYFGVRSPNGTYNGVIGSIVKNELDLCLTGFFIKEYMVPEMDFSVAVYDDKLCIFTPKAKQIPDSILPIFAVRYDLWIGFIFMGFVCSFLWALLRALNLHLNIVQLHGRNLEKDFRWQYVQILIDTWVVWVKVNITCYPPFHSERMFVASLSLISVIFGSIFESSLSTVFIHPLYYRDIHTLQELDESGLHILYKYASMRDDLFFSETSSLFANLNKKLRFVRDINEDVIEDVAAYGGKAGVTRLTNLMMQSLHLILSKKVWIVPECPKYYAISYVWPKDAPWDAAVNQLLLRMLNAGLINKFIKEMKSEVDIKIMRDHLHETNQAYKILTAEDLQLAFYVVLMGSLIAFFILLLERKLFANKLKSIKKATITQIHVIK